MPRAAAFGRADGCEALAGLPRRDRIAFFAEAVASGRTGTARKVAAAQARPALSGEIVVTVISGDGVETVSPPALPGDWVVRNLSVSGRPEEILVGAASFARRYRPPTGLPGEDGFWPVEPVGAIVAYTVVRASDGVFAFEAPWGRLQRARPGDAMVRSADDPGDIYVVHARVFAQTYETIVPAGPDTA